MLLRKHKITIIASLVCLILGMASGTFTSADDYLWYATLNKPWFTPPNWLFAPVWICIYILLGITFSDLWKNKTKFYNKLAIKILVINFIFNLAWSPIFFCLHNIKLALYNIYIIMLSLIILFIITRNTKKITMLLLPYIIWVSFATLLNYSLYILN